LSLPNPPANYDRSYMSRLLTELNKRDVLTYKRGADVEIVAARLILVAPNGGRWSVVVDNTGALSTVAA
jgi:hypothetical protein